MELSKGWQAWMDVYLAELRCRQLLAQSAAQLSKPKLVACFKFWHHDWHEASEASKEKGYGEQKKALEQELKA
eukprot:6408812-Prymnesium_polylepis.1